MRLATAGLCVCLLLGPSPVRLGADDPSFEGKPLSYWVEQLHEIPGDPQTASLEWRKAPWVLRRAGEPAIPALVSALGDDEKTVRRRALSGLLGMGATARPAVDALLAALGDEDAELRQPAAIILGQIGPGARAAVPALIGALKDADPRVRVAAASSLGEIGGLEAGPALDEAAKDPVPGVSFAARKALSRLRGESKPKPR